MPVVLATGGDAGEDFRRVAFGELMPFHETIVAGERKPAYASLCPHPTQNCPLGFTTPPQRGQ